MSEYVFDTYAIIEIIKGNQSYEPYLNSTPIVNDFVLAELCYIILKEHNKKVAFKYVDQYKEFRYAPSIETIKKASLFKYKNRKKNITYTDCISYIQAKKLKIKFLTGDKEFKNLPNVEFVK